MSSQTPVPDNDKLDSHSEYTTICISCSEVPNEPYRIHMLLIWFSVSDVFVCTGKPREAYLSPMRYEYFSTTL